MKTIRSTDRSGNRRSAHGELVEPLERSVAVESFDRTQDRLFERLEPLERLKRLERSDPRWERELSQITQLREPHSRLSS
jgi:hypothetical protein